MKKIFQIVDTYGWAIDTLAVSVVKACPHFDWRRMAVHPKDLERGKVNIEEIRESILWADVIDMQYWRVCSQLMELIPELKTKPIFLTHHNEKNILSYPWTSNIIHVVETAESERILREAYPDATIHLVLNSYDHRKFKYNMEYPPADRAVGYVGRVVPWKGLKDVARACYELGYPLMMMGKIDKPDYFAEIPVEHRQNMDMSFVNCEEQDRPDFYKNITCYVGNSGSGRETGPLGLIEAMGSGVPCVSTSAGIAADIGEHEENMMLVDYDDYDGLKDAISQVMESPTIQQRLRKNAWETVRGLNEERRGMTVRGFFNEFLYKDELVSAVIVATPERQDNVMKILEALKTSTYKTIEAVVVFDQALDPDEVVVRTKEAVREIPFPVHVLTTNSYGDYMLAKARNLGVIQADGEYILFLDSRMLPEPTAIEEFLKVLREGGKDAKVWVFGEKGGEKKTFVENFSMVRRSNFIRAGMCNERINRWGGMSQELRSRFASQGFAFGYVPYARATQLCKSSMSAEKRDGMIEMKNLLNKLNLH